MLLSVTVIDNYPDRVEVFCDMKKFTANCDFGGQQSPFGFNVGVPEAEHNPIHFQSDWLSKERGGNVGPEFVDCIMQIKEIADRNNVPLDELCVYALGTAISEDEEEHDEMDEGMDEYSDNEI